MEGEKEPNGKEVETPHKRKRAVLSDNEGKESCPEPAGIPVNSVGSNVIMKALKRHGGIMEKKRYLAEPSSLPRCKTLLMLTYTTLHTQSLFVCASSAPHNPS